MTLDSGTGSAPKWGKEVSHLVRKPHDLVKVITATKSHSFPASNDVMDLSSSCKSIINLDEQRYLSLKASVLDASQVFSMKIIHMDSVLLLVVRVAVCCGHTKREAMVLDAPSCLNAWSLILQDVVGKFQSHHDKTESPRTLALDAPTYLNAWSLILQAVGWFFWSHYTTPRAKNFPWFSCWVYQDDEVKSSGNGFGQPEFLSHHEYINTNLWKLQSWIISQCLSGQHFIPSAALGGGM